MAALCGFLVGPSTAAVQTPAVFCLDGAQLAESKARIKQEDKSLAPAMAKLLLEAEEALKMSPVSVMDKKLTAPSGDKHDYMSLGPYWWPDPKKPDGLPYIRRDGQVNPESRTNDTDRPAFGRMIKAVDTLAIAWYFTEKPAYTEHAAKLLRTWFLDPATKMNPDLQFGQAIPGKVLGRDIGIIDTRGLMRIADAATLLEGSKAWTNKDRQQMKAWCKSYLNWLRTSKHGLGEEKRYNNHATWYDGQVVSLALYVGDKDLAEKILQRVKTMRIDKHFSPDGSQKHELARTKSFGYSVMNLDGFFCLAQMGDKAGVDLWNYESTDGRGVRKALDFLAPYADPEKKWPHKQISSYSGLKLLSLLRRAATAYEHQRYEELITKLDANEVRSNRIQLLWPKLLKKGKK